MKENGIGKEEIIEALKMNNKFPKIKEEYQDISENLIDLQKQRGFHLTDNRLLIHKNYELNNECNLLVLEIESANRMLKLIKNELNKKREILYT